jgi:hypothetical protein
MYSVGTTIAPTATATSVLSSGEDAEGHWARSQVPAGPESGLSHHRLARQLLLIGHGMNVLQGRRFLRF